MDQQQLTFNEIEMPLDPGMSDILLVTLSAIMLAILVYVVVRLIKIYRATISSRIRHRHLRYLAWRKKLDAQQITEQTYYLLQKHFRCAILPTAKDLPPKYQQQSSHWLNYKNALNAARFSGSARDQGVALKLLIASRQWIK